MGFEMIFIFLLALIILGPKKLPEMAREIGKFMAEFKRASNDFKYQLQNEIQNVATETPAAAQPGLNSSGNTLAAPPPSQPMAQQTTSFTQTLLPPSVKTAISEIDTAHERLMRTARMAFDAQNFTLRPPEPPVAETTEAEEPGVTAVDANAPGAPAKATAAPHETLHETPHETHHETFHESSPVEAATGQPAPASAPDNSNSAQQSS
jgi:sec-independent protein translocase protein TatB